jgi:hypothetical protein
MRDTATIRADLDAARARFACADRVGSHFSHGVGCSGRSQRSIDRDLDRSIDAAKRVTKLEAELARAEAAEKARDPAVVAKWARLAAGFREMIKTRAKKDGTKLSADELDACRGLLRKCERELRAAA